MKYVETAKIIFKGEFAYRFNTAMRMLYTVTKMLFAYILWGAIYEYQQDVAGFGFGAMLTYYVLSSTISQLDLSDGISGEVSARILNGTFSARMVMPVNIFGFYAAQTVGVACFHLSLNLIAAVIWVFLFRIPFALTGDALIWAGALWMIALGLFFMMQLNFTTGILAFKFHEIWMFNMIKDGIIQFASGAMIPLNLLPGGLNAVMRFFPFYHVVYQPAMLLMGRNTDQMGMGIAVLLIWNAAFAWLNRYLYNRLRKQYDGVGI